MSEPTLPLFLSTMLVLLCTKRWGGMLSAWDIIELRLEWVSEPSSAGELTSLLYAIFLPECRKVCILCGVVTITWAETTVEATDDVDSRLLLASRCLSIDMRLLSAGQPIDWAKFSTEGVTGLLWPTSTRLRRLGALRARVVGEGEAVSTTVTAGSAVFLGDFDCGLRFLRIVMLRMSSVFHSRSGMSAMVGESLSAPACLAAASTSAVAGKAVREGVVGVTSFLSCSKASRRPRSSSTVFGRSSAGVAHVLSSRSEKKGSSRAVWYDVAREEGYVRIGGR